MSAFSSPANRPSARAILIGSAPCRASALDLLRQLGYQPTEADDPYGAMAELCQRPLVYRAIVLSLNGLYREELQIIAAVKRRFPHIEVWLAQTDGRAAALAEASRLGADGLLSEEGLHRFAPAAHEPDRLASTTQPTLVAPPAAPAPLRDHSPSADRHPAESTQPDPILTADELRALLQDLPAQPTAPQHQE
jgi:DNA-binding NarL/FixJ family response regulator